MKSCRRCRGYMFKSGNKYYCAVCGNIEDVATVSYNRLISRILSMKPNEIEEIRDIKNVRVKYECMELFKKYCQTYERMIVNRCSSVEQVWTMFKQSREYILFDRRFRLNDSK